MTLGTSWMIFLVGGDGLRDHPSQEMLLEDALGPMCLGVPLTVSVSAEPVSFRRIESSYAGAPVYRYTRSQSFDILDIAQKCFVLESPTQLVALHLQGPSAGQKGEGTQS